MLLLCRIGGKILKNLSWRSKMVSEESLISCFSNLGCNITDRTVIDKCVEICHTYNKDEEAFVELWVSYTVPHSLNIDPTIDILNEFEEQQLKKNDTSLLDNVLNAVSNVNIDAQSKEIISSNVLDMYSVGETSTSRQIKRARSPVPETGGDSKIRAVDCTFTPSTYSSQTNVPNRAPSIIVSGKILLHFGPDIQDWKKQNEYHVSIGKTDNPHVPKDAVYMYEMLSKQAAVLSNNCKTFGERLCHIWNEMELKGTNIRYVRNVRSLSQAAFVTWGRIFTMFDKVTGNKIVMLEGCKRPKGGRHAPVVRLDLNGIKRYSVFPGQIVAVKGINTSGNILVVKELFVKGYAQLPDTPRLPNDIKIYIAVGPFTPVDNLNYQPLWNLMDRVAVDEPDILILVGPFIEYMHPEIKKCILKDTYDDFFDKILAKLLQYLQRKRTRVVLVPSNRDVHHDAVFPTPEFTINANKLGSTVATLHSMPDPCIINVDGLQIGITSVDVLRHLGPQEVSNTSGMDRLGRLADHVLSQATFYPLYPAFTGLNLDTTLWKKYACFECQPHILILPSDLRYYCKVVNECLVLNPERLHKYIYAKLCIRPVKNGKWNPNNVSCEIAKV